MLRMLMLLLLLLGLSVQILLLRLRERGMGWIGGLERGSEWGGGEKKREAKEQGRGGEECLASNPVTAICMCMYDTH